MKKLFILLCVFSLIVSCKRETTSVVEPACNKGNAVYYWKTTFKLSDEERDFLSEHQIKRLYLRYFDVSRDNDFWRAVPVPEATLIFLDSIPQNLEVVPTVFIDNNLFKDADMSGCAELLVNRIRTMTATNDVPNVREVQLDCDWTETTETAYFDFLKQVRELLEKDSINLSTTIRLHQLRTKAPPVESGVLMCYNTGGVRNPKTNNSILSADDVALYAESLKKYPLSLDIAYPTFSWTVWFSGNPECNQFQALLRKVNPENENLLKTDKNRYKVISNFYQEGKYLYQGDEIRIETSDFDEIMAAKKLLESQIKNHSVILYHLDSANLSKYTKDEISQIYAH
ncbi:MAG: hypothetical protein LBI82_10365 [Dysgonamonadaceae bacterium]|jgi:hypothetical protein|nr:hypothetical protein [Dysgonamonadaceae bacterium]